MRRLGWGLRGKSLFALTLACALALLPALLIGWQLTEAIRAHFGEAAARNLTLLNRERILAPLTRELALSLRLADSLLLREMLADEANPEARRRLFEEAEGFRRDFRDRSCFVISRASLAYYFNQDDLPFSAEPRYHLEADDPEDSWFFATLEQPGRYNINVNYDAKLKQTRIWINVLVRDGERVVGLAGAGLDFSSFLEQFIGRAEAGVTPIIVNDAGAIQAHPDPARVALNSAGAEPPPERTLFGLLPTAEHPRLRDALLRSRAEPTEAVLLDLRLDGRPQRVAISYIPDLRWHVLTALDLHSADVVDTDWLWPIGLALLMLLLVLLGGFAYSVERLVLRPLRLLQGSAEAIAQGDYAVRLPPPSSDELGALTRAFATMVETVGSHTRELEGKVRERTSALEASHALVLSAHKKIDDSIDYASRIQRAILPDGELLRVLGEQHFVLWRPRDVVGGDFYVFRSDGNNFLIGVMDCAGHGVPGALMTMLARSAVDHALVAEGLRDPAALLRHADALLRQSLGEAQLSRAVATNTDAGLLYVDRERGEVVFAGAAISLFCSDGGESREVRGSRRALGDRRGADFVNVTLPLQRGTTYCLVTDGLLDQAGGEHGFGFGAARFADFIREFAAAPLRAQADALAERLAGWQGAHPQRDDITVLSFRLD